MKFVSIISALFLFSFMPTSAFAQATVDCSNVSFTADTFYVSMSQNSFSDTIKYNDPQPIVYPIQCLELDDTSIVSVRSYFSADECHIYTILQVDAPEADTVGYLYSVNFKSTDFPHNTVVTGNYTLTATECDCSFPVTLILQRPTGINDLALEGVSIFPNPASDFLVVSMTQNNSATIGISNLSGRKVISQAVNQAENKIDISGLASGIYFVEVTDQGKNFIQKIVIQ